MTKVLPQVLSCKRLQWIWPGQRFHVCFLLLHQESLFLKLVYETLIDTPEGRLILNSSGINVASLTKQRSPLVGPMSKTLQFLFVVLQMCTVKLLIDGWIQACQFFLYCCTALSTACRRTGLELISPSAYMTCCYEQLSSLYWDAVWI